MTKAEIEKLREMEKAATPAPWSWEGTETKRRTRYQHILAVSRCGENPCQGAGIADTYHCDEIGPFAAGIWEGQTLPPRSGKREDAAFIVAARNNLPALLDELESLRAERDRIEKIIDPNPSPGGDLAWLVERVLSNYSEGVLRLRSQLQRTADEVDAAVKVLLSHSRVLQNFVPGSEAHQLQAGVDQAHQHLAIALRAIRGEEG